MPPWTFSSSTDTLASMRKTAAALTAVFVLSTMLTSTATAQQVGEITNLRSTRQEAKLVVLTWDEVPSAAEYVVYRAEDLKILDVGNDNWAVIEGLSPGKAYEFQVEALGSDNATVAYSKVISVSTADAPPITGLQSTRQEPRLVVLTWNRVPGADAYYVIDAETTTIVDSGDDNWAVVTDLVPGRTYEFYVQAVAAEPDGERRLISESQRLGVSTTRVALGDKPAAPEVVNTFVDTSAVVLRIKNETDTAGNPLALQYAVLVNNTPVFVRATNQLEYTWFVDQVEPGETNSYYVVAISFDLVSGDPSETFEITIPTR